MNKGWLELESDPGLFTLLLEDFGVQGVQVEEIYDLQKDLEGVVYGFIFLFKWTEERRARRKIAQEEETFVPDEKIVNSMFFAKQIIPDSCATHALLSVLLNCDSKLKLGETLNKLKTFTKNMNPEDKGYAIGNMPELARAHNSHARIEPSRMPEKQQGVSAVRTAEAFHFVSYVPIDGRLFELDGLKPYPIDHGPWGEQENWADQFKRVISERLIQADPESTHDIRYNLMAVVPDKIHLYDQKLKTLKLNRKIIMDTLQQMVRVTTDSPKTRIRGVKTEPVLSRTAKDINSENGQNAVDNISLNASGQPLRSTRLREKAAAAAAALAIEDSSMGGTTGGDEFDMQVHSRSPVPGDLASAVGGDNDIDDDMEHDLIKSELVKPDMDQQHFRTVKQQLQTVKDTDVKIQISVSGDKDGNMLMPTTVASTDITKPLIIQTKFGTLPTGPATGSSTDTASEIGSCMNSPVCSTGQPSPNLYNSPYKYKISSISDLDSIKNETFDQSVLSPAKLLNESSEFTTPVKEAKSEPCSAEKKEHGIRSTNSSPGDRAKHKHFSNHQGFTPKDLLQLLMNVEKEIKICEMHLKDEEEKKRKYSVDDCRRTHNYDQFICTFLSMLAQQGHLTELVEEHSSIKKRTGLSPGSGNGKVKRTDNRKKTQKGRTTKKKK